MMEVTTQVNFNEANTAKKSYVNKSCMCQEIQM